MDLLRSLSLQQWEGILQEEELTMPDLAAMSFQELRVALPTMPSGAVLRLHRAAQDPAAPDKAVAALA